MNRKNTRIPTLLPVFLLLVLTRCATYQPLLVDEEREVLSDIALWHRLEVDQLLVPDTSRHRSRVHVGFGTGVQSSGGSVGVLFRIPIEQQTQDRTTQRAQALRELIRGYRFRPVIERELQSLREGEHFATFSAVQPLALKPGNELAPVANHAASLAMTSRYSVSPAGDAIEVQLDYTFRHRRADGSPATTNRRAIYQSSASNWSRESLTLALETGAREVVALMLRDLGDSRTDKDLADTAVQLPTHKGSDVEAYPLGTSSAGGLGYYRLRSGRLYAIPDSHRLQLHESR